MSNLHTVNASASPENVDDFLEPKSVNATLDKFCELATTKWSHRLGFFFQSLAGGAMVSFGAMLAVAVGAGIPEPGLANLVSGLVFGFSFVVIMVSGSSLITSDMAAGFIALWRRQMSFSDYLGYLFVGWLGNVLGAFIFVAIIAAGPGEYGAPIFLMRAHMIAISKVGPNPLSVFCMAIICTWLLQTAFFLYVKARTDIGKMMMAYYGPLAFVAGMTEHCIANIGMIGLPLLMQGPFAQSLGKALPKSGKIAELTWGFGHYGLARNELLTWCGNWVGGTVFVAIVFMIIAWTYKSHDAAKANSGQRGGAKAAYELGV